MQPKEVLLFHPKTGHERNYKFFWYPYSLINIAAPLHQNKWKVKFIDNNVENKEKWSALDEIIDNCLCIGISAMIGYQIYDGLKFAKAVREYNPDLPIIWGGAGPTVIPFEFIKSHHCDVVVYGQGEIPFLSVVNIIKDGGSFANIKGIIFKKGNQIIPAPPCPMFDINQFPTHPFDLLDVTTYIRDDPDINDRTFNYVSSQGCPHSCGFCSEVAQYKHRWTALSSRKVINEIEHLVKDYDINGVKFYDANFTVDKKRVLEICQLFMERKLKIKWAASSTIEDILYLYKRNPKWLELFEKSGCSRLLLGAETANQDELELIKATSKVKRPEDSLKVARILSKYEIIPSFTLIVGFPGSTDKHIEKTVKFGEMLKSANPSSEVKIHFYTPYPGTPLWNEGLPQKCGFRTPITLDEWAMYDYYTIETPWVNKKWEKIVREFNVKYCPYVSKSD